MQIPFLRVAGMIVVSVLFALQPSVAQDALQVDLKKPEKFENKKLGYEKTTEKKMTVPRRFIQNTTTHYNYYYNANVKMEEIIARVKAGHRDDFTQLLPFYNYSLDKTANEKQELDSVIYKSTIAILIHDLRTNWLDNMYMLMGKAYYFRNELDSAYLTFQYINYAFSPKEKDGYDKVIGSNANSEEGGNAFSISTKEKKNVVHKVFTRPPSRNESFLWQIRTFLAKDEMAEASGLIETLKNDPNFPERLDAQLAEVQAHWYYKQNAYDSAAFYLEKALSVAEGTQELARWEFLIGQLYERASKSELAEKFYARAIKHTYDPVMEVFARLNSIRQNKGEKNYIQENINELVKMARKEKFLAYRDVIFYTAAQMELERNNVAIAKYMLEKSAEYSQENPKQRNRSFLQLADISYNEKNYLAAKRYYDSVDATSLDTDPLSFEKRRDMLAALAGPAGIIYRQDSLQRIAAMPDAEREVFLRKMVRQLRRAQGLKEDEPTAASLNNPSTTQQQPADLFINAPKGEWYFDNASLKSKGFSEFRQKWGNRPNVDNWRRLSAINQFAQANQANNNAVGNSLTPQSQNTTGEISYDAITSNIPLNSEKLKLSNDSIESAMMQLARAQLEVVEDYPVAIETYEKLLNRFPASIYKEEALFGLYYSYYKMGDLTKANYYKIQLQQLYPAGKYAAAVDPVAASKSPDSVLRRNANAAYEKIYTAFIEGNFDQAEAEKKLADSLYGERYWTPQLLYIEAIYHIKHREDSIAKVRLSQLIMRFGNSPLRPKAEVLQSVLGRRAQIETYLTNLQVKRVDEDTATTVVTDIKPPVTTQVTPPPVVKPESQQVNPPPVTQPKKEDQKVVTPPPPVAKPTYTFKADEPQLVVVVLDKVDVVYVTETRNAFNRYNREKYYNKVIEISNVPLDDNIKLVVMNNFENANAAIEYVEKARKLAATEIVPWLPAGKYSFYIISAQNLEILKTTKDLNVYKTELNIAFPGKF